jgi:HAD superfamily hydrolase (TIGR01450 family)
MMGYDGCLLDIDGVLLIGSRPVPGAVATLAAVREAGLRVGFVTNNASRSPAKVARRLHAAGFTVEPDEVVTSGQVAVRYLADQLPAGSRVLVVGTDDLVRDVGARGLIAVGSADELPAAVLQGHSRHSGWAELAEAAVAIGNGATWVATNADPALPSERGLVPGNGAMIAAVATATGKRPIVIGKPHPRMHLESVVRTRVTRPIVVGDRLDTDISGGIAAGCASLLVLSGITDPARLLAAGPEERPNYLAHDIRGLLAEHRAPRSWGRVSRCGAWRVVRRWRQLELTHLYRQSAPESAASGPESDLDALRALCHAAWASTRPVLRCEAGDPEAADILARLGLDGC